MKYPDCDIRCARILDKVIQYEGPDSVAAFIAEPIQLSTGNIVPPDGYFPIIREICTRYDVLLIYDEIITGFGRTGNMWGAETVGAVPDILCMGKGMSCGYSPVSGFAAREKLAWAFWGDASEGREFADGHTYGGNPISSAVCIAALQELLENDLVARSRDMGQYLTAKLETLRELGVIGEIRGKGLMIGVELVKDPQTMDSFPAEMGFGNRVGNTCIHKYKAMVRHAPNWLALAPPFIVQEAELDMLVERIAASIRDVLKEVGER
jgi:adenosylmethionine-8-amino-7-oxononanoate aminotransferase